VGLAVVVREGECVPVTPGFGPLFKHRTLQSYRYGFDGLAVFIGENHAQATAGSKAQHKIVSAAVSNRDCLHRRQVVQFLFRAKHWLAGGDYCATCLQPTKFKMATVVGKCQMFSAQREIPIHD